MNPKRGWERKRKNQSGKNTFFEFRKTHDFVKKNSLDKHLSPDILSRDIETTFEAQTQ